MKIVSFMLKLAKKTGIGKRISEGIQNGKMASMFAFQEAESGYITMFKEYTDDCVTKGLSTIKDLESNKIIQSILTRFIKKNNITAMSFSGKTENEILEMLLQKSGVVSTKFAQIISSDKDIMSKLPENLQKIIKKAQSENPFSRTVEEAQKVVNKLFEDSSSTLLTDGTLTLTGRELITPKIQLLKPLSTGSVGEAYLAKNEEGKEVIVKLIKKGVDEEELELEESLYKYIIEKFSSSSENSNKHIQILKNLFKDWKNELNFNLEYKYNKQLQTNAKRYQVADILQKSSDGSCIIMEKAQGIQMNDLLKILQDYRRNPTAYHEQYAEQISNYPWLKNPEEIIKELPETITKAFDEMFMFMKSKKNGSILHGDPHMGNYFITQENGKLTPIFIDTGNCVLRSSKQIQEDLKFLTNYFVGNSKGLANYFVGQCEFIATNTAQVSEGTRLITSSQDIKEIVAANLAKDIDEMVFAKKQDITDINAVIKTIQVLLEKHGLMMRPESTTAMKAQMQFYTGISEVAALNGKTIDVKTIIKDIPQALWYMLKSKINPIKSVKEATQYACNNQVESTASIYQFLSPKSEKITLTQAPNYDIVPFGNQLCRTA